LLRSRICTLSLHDALPISGLLLRPLVLRWLLLTVARLCDWFSCIAGVSKKCDDALPECFLLRSGRALFLKTPATAPSSRPTAPLDRKSTRLNSSHVAISYA